MDLAASVQRVTEDAMLAIAREARDDPDAIRSAPHGRPTGRLDEVRAAKQPVVRFRFEEHDHPEGAGAERLEARKGA